MKHILFVLVLMVFVLSACGTPATPVPVLTNTPVPLPTETPIPTATFEPSPTPMPIGGGGKFIMQESGIWYSASSDGTNLKTLNSKIWSVSPDGKRALTYRSEYEVALTNLDGTSEILLDYPLIYYINSFYQTALWLPDGKVILLAFDQDQPKKIAAYIVTPSGRLTKWGKLSQVMKNYASFLFLSPDGENLYWQNSACPKNAGQCESEYYVSKLDDSEQKRILQHPTPHQDIHISPSGEYISYMVFPSCYLYKTADNTTKKLTPPDGSFAANFCFGDHWSPTEDQLFGKTKIGYSILSVPDGKITTFSEIINVGSCNIANWMPDGKSVFLSVCTEANSKSYIGQQMGKAGEVNFYENDFFPTIGARLINISDGEVTEYPNTGFCYAVISPDSKWVLFDQCKNENNLTVTSQLLNLDTKEMIPVFQELVPDAERTKSYGSWMVIWTP